MEAVLSIVQLALVPILLAAALAVRFAGKSKVLNVVDYARVSDPAALHRWAGERLLLLPVAFLVGGSASYHVPGFALLFLGGAIIASLCVAVWLALGAERFQSARVN
ncbi:hypothetical protein [Luteimonas sp. SDU101]|uniref:hypothetical protein n=1 Tax=Luteimonas sp. SDU101 TaxID=3422593 RepID=UPI003EC13FF0